MKACVGKKFMFEGRAYQITLAGEGRITTVDVVSRQILDFIAGTNGGYPNLEEIPMSEQKRPECVDHIKLFLGKAVKIETREGAIRTATLTKIVWGSIEMDGRDIKFPDRIYLNDDGHDFIPWDAVAKISRRVVL